MTIRDIAAAAGVSPALVLHHFGSKDGLRAQVDQYAAEAFDALFAELDDDAMEAMVADGGASASLAEAFGRTFPPGSPLPSYLRRLLLTNDPAGAALFGRWYTRPANSSTPWSSRAAPLPARTRRYELPSCS